MTDILSGWIIFQLIILWISSATSEYYERKGIKAENEYINLHIIVYIILGTIFPLLIFTNEFKPYNWKDND